jgi:hypothetical protein
MAAAAPPYTHWKAFSAASKDFDAGTVWKYTTKDLTPENDKRWICVFCSCNKGGWNATKALYHMAVVGVTTFLVALGQRLEQCPSGSVMPFASISPRRKTRQRSRNR